MMEIKAMTKYISDRYYTDSHGNLYPVTWTDVVLEYASAIVCALLIAYGIIGVVT